MNIKFQNKNHHKLSSFFFSRIWATLMSYPESLRHLDSKFKILPGQYLHTDPNSYPHQKKKREKKGIYTQLHDNHFSFNLIMATQENQFW